MERVLLWIGRGAGLAGVVLIAVAAGARLAGRYYLGGFESQTLLHAGTAATAVGCLAYVARLSECARNRPPG